MLVKDRAHPSTRAIPQPFEVFDEIYQFDRYDPARVHLLLYMAKHPESGEPGEFPLAWTRDHGKGRVFYTALGHRDDVLDAEWYGAHLPGRHPVGPGSGQVDADPPEGEDVRRLHRRLRRRRRHGGQGAGGGGRRAR